MNLQLQCIMMATFTLESDGGDNGTRGFVWAFKADTLEPLWKEPFWTVPKEERVGRKVNIRAEVPYGHRCRLIQIQI